MKKIIFLLVLVLFVGCRELQPLEVLEVQRQVKICNDKNMDINIISDLKLNVYGIKCVPKNEK